MERLEKLCFQKEQQNLQIKNFGSIASDNMVCHNVLFNSAFVFYL